MKKFCLLSLFFCLCFAFEALGGEQNVNIYEHGRPLSETPIYDRHGNQVKLTDFKGDFVMAVFWSRNCRPCVKELDDFNGFYNKVKDNGIKVLMISRSDEWQDAAEQERFLQRFDAPDLPFYVDLKGRLAGDFGVFTSPHTVLISQTGEEIGRIHGSADWDSDRVVEYIYGIKAEIASRIKDKDKKHGR